MSETVPAASAGAVPAVMEEPLTKKRVKKPAGLTSASRKASYFSVSKLITEALSVSQERVGMSLAALKKALAAAGYDVEKNNSRIKLSLKSLVNKGILVQTRGTGASGSFKLSKKVLPKSTRRKANKSASAKTKKLVLSRDSKSPKTAKTNKRAKKPRATASKKPVRSGRKAKGAKSKQQQKSPVKARATKSKLTQHHKANIRKSTSRK
ncbi:histone H1t [Piliocolobus tephrosceles]|uniref:H1.6 linker histone, cluster member n=1 Tax=Piliocolobus tephrosceles TaxID=591936 RepID=A0A8C9G8U3_9PRIM|nr:histone H1t [Piliocolobus tephrosceles]